MKRRKPVCTAKLARTRLALILRLDRMHDHMDRRYIDVRPSLRDIAELWMHENFRQLTLSDWSKAG